MTFLEEGMAWLSGLFLFVIVLFIAIMIWRNRAAKSDTVRREEEDTIINSVSLKPKKNSRKLD